MSIHALIVDDKLGDVAMLRMALLERRPDIELHVAVCGHDAIVLIEHHLRPALAVVDLNLPRVSGGAFIQWLHDHGRMAGMQVVLYTGFHCDHALKQLPSGVKPDHCRQKPETVRALDAVADWMTSLLPVPSTESVGRQADFRKSSCPLLGISSRDPSQ